MNQILSGQFIHPDNLEELYSYKYTSGLQSYLNKKMNPFCEWAVTLIPLWVSTNLITLCGGLFVMAPSMVMFLFDFILGQPIPSICYFFTVICFFRYYTLDQCDGIQARRTKSSSPLGQILDHSGDSVFVVFITLTVCYAVKATPLQVLLGVTSCQALPLVSNWMELNSDIFHFQIGNSACYKHYFISAKFTL